MFIFPKFSNIQKVTARERIIFPAPAAEPAAKMSGTAFF